MSVMRDQEIFVDIDFDVDGHGDNQTATLAAETIADGIAVNEVVFTWRCLDEGNVQQLSAVMDNFFAELDKLPESTRKGLSCVIERVSYATYTDIEQALINTLQELVNLGKSLIP